MRIFILNEIKEYLINNGINAISAKMHFHDIGFIDVTTISIDSYDHDNTYKLFKNLYDIELPFIAYSEFVHPIMFRFINSYNINIFNIIDLYKIELTNDEKEKVNIIKLMTKV